MKKERKAQLAVGLVSAAIILLAGTEFMQSPDAQPDLWKYVLFSSVVPLSLISLIFTRSGKAQVEAPAQDDRYREWFEHMGDAMVILEHTPPYRVLEANESACRWLGLPREAMLVRTAADLTQKGFVPRLDVLQRQLNDRSQLIIEWEARTNNGGVLPVELNCKLTDTAGRKVLVVAARDLTEKRAAERKYRESEQTFKSLFEHNPNAICVYNRHGELIRVNDTVFKLMGYTDHELRQQKLKTLLADDCLDAALSRIERCKAGEPQTFDSCLIHKEGFRLDVNITIVPVVGEKDGELNGTIAIFQDISERKRSEERVRHMAYYDDRTGLPNRRLFKDRLTVALGDAKRQLESIGVFYLDIDRFKLINDSFGHDYGDMLLMQVAERFTRCVSDTDFLARTEGDEFAFYYTNIAIDDLTVLAERILELFDRSFQVGQYEFHITASMGIASYDSRSGAEPEAETLLKHADIALSRAKEKSGGRYQVFNEDMLSVSFRRLTIENDLRKAIQQNEFMLYFQPQIDISSGRLVGFEALIRWNHPDKGIVPPKDFIPVAEESGLIVPIGEWVLTEACLHNKQLQDRGLVHVPVSVNLSMRQFMQSNLRDKLVHILDLTGLNPSYLELEITESMTMDVDFATHCLLELKQLGVQISIDDFGTGYSSLSYLKQFPIDRLKIDRSFVRDIMTDPNDAAIVSTIIAMAHHLHLSVIAEGVETEDQLQFLHRNQCHQVQGFCVSPPLRKDELESFILRQTEAASGFDS